jgi:oligosaccharide repeat unit polymerase
MYDLKLAIFGTLLLALAVFNRSVGRRWTYPPAVFSLFWSAVLFGLCIAGDFFYPIALVTMLVFLLGAVCFSAAGLVTLGCMQVLQSPRAPTRTAESAAIGRLLDWAIVLLILGLPLFYRRLTDLASAAGISDFWVALRTQIAYGSDQVADVTLGGFARIIAVATFLCFIATAELDETFASKRRAAILISLTVGMHTLTMARLGAYITIFGCAGIFLVKSQRIPVRALIVTGISLISVFALPAILLGKGGSTEAGLGENASGVMQSVEQYSLGGSVAFDEAIAGGWRRPLEIPDMIRIPARSLGLVPQPIARERFEPFVFTPSPTNVYTIYYQYFTGYGFAGVVFGMLLIGAACTLVYAAAIHGSRPSLALLGLIFGNLLVSNAGDGFIAGLSYNVQAVAVIVILYRMAGVLDVWAAGPRTAVSGLADGVPCVE